jgi:hypothetical protein
MGKSIVKNFMILSYIRFQVKKGRAIFNLKFNLIKNTSKVFYQLLGHVVHPQMGYLKKR